MSLYDDLGVPPDATPEQIAAAYRKAAKEHHPDAGGDADAFARVGRAMAVLRDPERRAEYDRSGKEDFTEGHPDAVAREHLMAMFTQKFAAFIDGKFGTALNLAESVQRSLIDEARKQQIELSRVNSKISSAKKALERLVFKGQGTDVIGAMFDQQIAQMVKIAGEMEQRVQQLERAAELADDWDWEADPAPQWTGYDHGSGSYGSTNPQWTRIQL